MFTEVIAINGNTFDFNKLRDVYYGSCHCISVDTDMETYVDIEALEEECLDEFIKELGETYG